MLNTHTIVNICLIFSGAIIMLISIVRSKELMVALPFVPERDRQHVRQHLALHRTLMIFFLCGYLVVMISFTFHHSIISETFVSLIFLFGAIFVLIGILLQSRLLAAVQITLQGILPICCKCKRIRFVDTDPQDQQTWKGIEEYISEKTRVGFTHGYCPECFAKVMKDIAIHKGDSAPKQKLMVTKNSPGGKHAWPKLNGQK